MPDAAAVCETAPPLSVGRQDRRPAHICNLLAERRARRQVHQPGRAVPRAVGAAPAARLIYRARVDGARAHTR
eukprot:362435-Chlamydomonas_euryale.AAC.2